MKQIYNKKLVVLNFLIDHRVGGPHKYVDGLSTSLQDSVISINFTCGKSKWCKNSLLNFRKISKFLYPFEVFLNIFLASKFIYKYKNSNKFNLIICIHGVHNIAPSIAAWLMGVPSILLVHESMKSLSIFAAVTKLFVRLNKGNFLSVSLFGAKQYNIENAQIVNSPVDLKYWNIDGLPKRNSYNGTGPFKIIFVGNLSRIKNIDGLINSLKKIDFEICLNIIGSSIDEEYTNYLIKISKNLTASNKYLDINFSGWRESADIKSAIYDADLFIMTSHSEGCPIAMVEAISLGCLPLVTKVGDVEDFLSPISQSFLINGHTEEHISASLVKIKKYIESINAHDLNLMRENLRFVAEDKFDISNISKIFYLNYQKTLSQYYE